MSILIIMLIVFLNFRRYVLKEINPTHYMEVSQGWRQAK